MSLNQSAMLPYQNEFERSTCWHRIPGSAPNSMKRWLFYAKSPAH